ncbi:MAG TPA: nucleotidyltransferase family protein [Candidatus Brocadiia bacterium]|nr:nucleotidyltransferase family protein [Candidatus Brocadiia bacterium]
MELYNEFLAAISAFNRDGVRYAVVSGIALAFHGRPRFTRDIDIMIHPEGLDKVRRCLSSLGYIESAEPWMFKTPA